MNKSLISLVSPRFCLSARDVTDLCAEFGPHQARFIRDVPAEWFKELRKYLEENMSDNLSPIEEKRLSRALALIRRNGYLIEADSKREQSRIRDSFERRDNAVATDYEFVIGDGLDPEPFIAWDDVYDDIRLSRHRNFRTNGSSRDLLGFVYPLLKTSREVVMIDPYFNPFGSSAQNSNNKDFLLGVFEILKNSPCSRLRILTLDKKKTLPPNIHERFESQFGQFIRDGLKLEWHIFTEGVRKYFDLHDRVIFTDKGGIELGKGFSRSSSKQPDLSLSFMDRGVLDLMHDRFSRLKSTSMRTAKIRFVQHTMDTERVIFGGNRR